MGPWTDEYFIGGPVSEDCLYLNVWTPAASSGEKLPVLVFIHGGGFVLGSGSVPIYEGAPLASQGVVFVSINYRLGLYGFLAHPDLAAENPVGASGNYGLLDQIQALKWVKANIAAFGGDPDKVTIAGESAGAASVFHLIASPLAKGLFIRAIAMSGPGMGLKVPERAVAERTGQLLLETAGVSTIEQLRKLDAAELDAAVAKLGPTHLFWPSVDGWVLPNAGMIDSNTNDVPVLAGMTANEMTGMNQDYGRMTPQSWHAELERTYGSLAGTMAGLYPARDNDAANASLLAHTRDRGLASMAQWARRRLRAGSSQPIYAYLWTHIPPGTAPRYGAFHTSQMPYVFGTLDKLANRSFTEVDWRLSQLLRTYWVNFVKAGDPNGGRAPPWPRLTLDSLELLELGDDVRARPILSSERLRAFEHHVEAGGKLGLFFGMF